MSTDEREWQTRKERIDTKLLAQNPQWNIIDYTDNLDTASLHGFAVREYPTATGPADYALFVHGKLLGILEAKKVKVGAKNVLEQAKRYSKSVFQGSGNWDGYRVPFLYASNGEKIYFIDVRNEKNLSREIQNFHTIDAISEMSQTDYHHGYDWLKNNPLNIQGIRDYQKEAVESVESAIVKGKREMFLGMATGTGKTFTTVAMVYRLLESKIFRRVLFLVDRKALAIQAVTEFSSFNTPKGRKFNQEYDLFSQNFKRGDFEDEPFDPNVLDDTYLKTPDNTKTFVYVGTIQRMTIKLFGRNANVIDGENLSEYEEEDTIDIPIHAFDLVIADECHRGYNASETGIWRKVIEHFDAIKIGLTATPAKHTAAIFKNQVFYYGIKRAVKEGHLVDYSAVFVNSNVRINGAFLKEGDSVGEVDTETGQVTYANLEDEREFASEDIERKITAPDSNQKIIEEVAKYAFEFEEENDRFPKILIFASNDLQHTSHADQLVEICREIFNRGDDFVQKITGNPNVDKPLQKIKEFRNRPKPMVVVTVDMLTTGVDIPDLEFLVFLRPVKSRILWEQMMGRGTRKSKRFDKKQFIVFDCFNGTLIQYFKGASDFSEDPPQKESVPISKIIDNIYRNVDRDYNVKVLEKRFKRIEKKMSGEAIEKFASFIPNGDIGKFAEELSNKIDNEFINTITLLRNEEFQKLLVNYPKAKRSFLIGYDVEDEVSSEVMIHQGEDVKKPEDYLESFSQFVREHADEIEAIRILMNRPKEWNTNVLSELRKKLEHENFPEPVLQKAYKLVYNKELADIISIVKHAAKEEEPVFTVQERVEKAIHKVTEGKSLNEEQKKWMENIKEHLINNLTLDIEDFDLIPIFSDRGGMRKAKEIFGSEIQNLVEEINHAIAS